MVCKNCNTEFTGLFCPVCGATVVPLPEQQGVNPNSSVSNTEPQNDMNETPVQTQNMPGPTNSNANFNYNQQTAPVETDKDAAYKAAAKRYWYCFLLPILFFIPITDEYKTYECNKKVANNALWVLILNVAGSVLGTVFSSFEINILSLACSLIVFVNGIFATVAFICALAGKGIRMPIFGNIKIIK